MSKYVKLEDVLNLVETNSNHFKPSVSKKAKELINALPTIDDDSKHIEIYRWLLGHEDFPARQDGQGVYYWRTPLRKKLLKIGIDADRFFMASDKINKPTK